MGHIPPLISSLKRLRTEILSITKRIVEQNNLAYVSVWNKVSTIAARYWAHIYLEPLLLWVSIVLHSLMTLVGATNLFLKITLRSTFSIRPELKRILREAWFEFLVGMTFVSSYGCWLLFLLLQKGGADENLFLLGILAVFGLLLSIRLVKLFYRVLQLNLPVTLISLGTIPLYVLGIPWGLFIFLSIGFFDIAYSTWGLAKNLQSAIKESSHLLITPILLFLLISATTGVTDYRSNLEFNEAIAILSDAVVDFLGMSDSFRSTMILFYLGTPNTLDFSFSTCSERKISSVPKNLSPTLSRIEAKCERILYLIKNKNAILTNYVRKSAEALRTGVAIMRTWIKSAKLIVSTYHQRDFTSDKIAKLQHYRNFLDQNATRLNELLADPVLSLPPFSGWRGGVKDGLSFLIRQIEWTIEYYPSLNLMLNVSQDYDKAGDFLLVNLQLRNVGTEPTKISSYKVGTHFEQIYWFNYHIIESIYENCYRPSSIEIHENITELQPNCSTTITMNFTEIELSLSQYKHDFRTFVHPSIFIIFPSSYTQINARMVFKTTLQP